MAAMVKNQVREREGIGILQSMLKDLGRQERRFDQLESDIGAAYETQRPGLADGLEPSHEV